MSVVELPDIRANTNKTNTRSKKSENDKYRKLAIIKSVDKLVRKNDIQSVIGYDNDYYPKQLEDQKRVDEAFEVHANLTELKRSCDSLRLQGLNKEQEIEKMRKEIESMQLQKEQYEGQQKKLDYQEKSLKVKNEEQQKLLNESLYMRKVYEHMLQRMKKDQLVYQLRANQYERELQHAQQQYSAETYKYQQISDLYEKTKLAHEEVKHGMDLQNINRKKNLDRFKEDLDQRQQVERKRDERIKRQQEIAEVAANDIKDSSLKQWRKLMLVHKFLYCFLKHKMQRGIAQYENLETAFQKIKASTGISDANEIVHKFLGREQTYAHLLISISDFEKKISQLKTDNQELQNQLLALKQENHDMDKGVPAETYKQKEELINQDKLVQEIEAKATLAGLLNNKLKTWMKRNLKKLGQKQDKDFKTIVDIVRDKLLNLSQTQQNELIAKTVKSGKKEIFDPEFQKRNVRVKPKKEKAPQQINTSMQESYSRDEEDLFEDIPLKDEDFDDEIEENHIKEQREAIKQKK